MSEIRETDVKPRPKHQYTICDECGNGWLLHEEAIWTDDEAASYCPGCFPLPTEDALRAERDALRAEVEDARKQAFAHGYLLACCNIMNLHGDSVIAFDVLAEAGISEDEATAMDLCEYDEKALAKIRAERSRESPFRAALSTKGGETDG